VFAAFGALALVLIAVTAIILLTSSSSPAPHRQSYSLQVTRVFSPVIAANKSLTISLQGLTGSQASIHAAQAASAHAQSAVGQATGALSVLTAPPSQQALSQQSQQALTEEAGYLQAVSAALSDPTGQSAASLRALAASTQSALVPVSEVAPGASDSLGGTDSLLNWVAGAAAQAKRQAQAAQQKQIQKAAQQTTTVTQVAPPAPTPQTPPAFVTPSGNPVPGSWTDGSASSASVIGTPYSWQGGQNCDQNIFAGDNTSCGFANNIFMVVAAASHYANVIPGSITATNPDDGSSYSLTCTMYTGTDSQTDLQCITGSGMGTAFPVWAANVYYG
jgi:hypothetical protein